jgi:hypothetical protein
MGERGKFIVLRPADAQKSVWLDRGRSISPRTIMRAFARPAPLLLAVIIMSDSDDTTRAIRADIEGLTLN